MAPRRVVLACGVGWRGAFRRGLGCCAWCVITSGQTALDEADQDGGGGHLEVPGQRGRMADAATPGALEGPRRYQAVGGEVVGGLLGLLGGAAARGTGVEAAGVAVVDDVLELVQQCQAAARRWLAAVEADDPVVAVPAAEARHRQGLAHHSNVRQGSDPLVGRCAGLPWAAGEGARQCGSLPLGHGKRLAEAAARAWNEGSEATQDRALRGVHNMPPFM